MPRLGASAASTLRAVHPWVEGGAMVGVLLAKSTPLPTELRKWGPGRGQKFNAEGVRLATGSSPLQ